MGTVGVPKKWNAGVFPLLSRRTTLQVSRLLNPYGGAGSISTDMKKPLRLSAVGAVTISGRSVSREESGTNLD